MARTFTAKYADVDGNDVSSKYTSVWTITNATFDTSKITQTIVGDNKIKLYYTDESIVGEKFTLNVVDSNEKVTPASINITLWNREF